MENSSASNGRGDAGGRCEDIRQHLARVYDACADSLFRYAAMLLADTAGAEDAVHQAFVKLVAMGGRLDEIESVKAYLRRAVRNECYRLLRRRSRREQTAKAPALLEAVSAGEPEDGEPLREGLERALRALPAGQREVVHMKVFEKMTFREIGERLGISMNTAASRYRYALSRLRELLGRMARDKDERT
jgi:RNA polymerase sigma-70 factor (ECF subfamily)